MVPWLPEDPLGVDAHDLRVVFDGHHVVGLQGFRPGHRLMIHRDLHFRRDGQGFLYRRLALADKITQFRPRLSKGLADVPAVVTRHVALSSVASRPVSMALSCSTARSPVLRVPA